MKTLILIKHYKFNDLTDACIQSIYDSYLGDAKVVIIDSTPDNDYKHPLVTEYRKVDNSVPLIKSYNLFFEDGFDFYVYASNDIIVHRNWLVGMIEAVNKNSSIGVLAPMYDQTDGGVLYFPVPKDLLPGSKQWQRWLDHNLPPAGSYTITNHVDNVLFAFTKKTVDKIGLMDDNFPGAGWGANLDYCYRARKAGFLVVASRGSFIHHAHRGTYGKIDPDYVNKAIKQRDDYLRQKYGDPSIVW